MNPVKTVKELISWGSNYSKSNNSLLSISQSGEEYYVECVKNLSFLGRQWRKVLSFFGWGSSSLLKVVAVVREVLNEQAEFGTEPEPQLKKVIKLLQNKIDSYEKRKFLWIFPLPRPHIPPLVEPEYHKIHKTASSETLTPGLSKVPLSIRRGIYNEGNTCFAASTIQALLACGIEVQDELLRKFMYSIKNSSLSAVDGISEILGHIFKQKWNCREEDPEVFLNAIFPLLEKQIIEQRCNLLSRDASLQDVIDGKYQYKKRSKIISAAHPPSFLSMYIDGRRDHLNRYNDMPVTVSPTISVATDQGTKKEYRMASVIMYVHTPHHYYTLEPVYDSSGKIAEWIEYNDSSVTRLQDSPELQARLKSYGYMFFFNIPKQTEELS